MTDILGYVVAQAWASLKITGVHLSILMGPGLFLACLMHLVSTRLKTGAWNLLGRRLYLGLFGWLGVGIHELGHAIMCPVFGHRVEKLRLFSPDASAQTLGYVKHSYNPRNPYQVVGNFFISLGPIILGTAIIWTAAYFLLSSEIMVQAKAHPWGWENFHSLDSSWNFVASTWDSTLNICRSLFTTQNGVRWQTWVFSYILASVGSGISLSWEDITGGFFGFAVFACLLYVIIIVAGLFGGVPPEWTQTMARHLSFIYPFMTFALILNTLLACAVTLLNLLVRAGRG